MNNSLVYVPSFTNSSCVNILRSNTIRVFDSVPTSESTITYTDYYINSHYLSDTGSITFSSVDPLPTCLNVSRVTNNVFYRNDIDSILVVTFIILLVCFYFPFRIISRLFGRWLKW